MLSTQLSLLLRCSPPVSIRSTLGPSTDNFSSAGEHTHKTYTPQEEDSVRQSRPKTDTSLGSKIISPVRKNHGITKSSEVLVIPDTHLVGAYFGMPTSPVSSPGMRSVQPVRQGHQGTCTAYVMTAFESRRRSCYVLSTDCDPFGKLPYRDLKLDLTSGSFEFSPCSPFLIEQTSVVPVED